MGVIKIKWTPNKVDRLVELRKQGKGFFDIALRLSALYDEPISEWAATSAFRKYASEEDKERYDGDYVARRERGNIFNDPENPHNDKHRACWLHLRDLFYEHPEHRPVMTFNPRRGIREVYYA